VLLAELSGDIGAESVGRLITQESHLLEKSSRLQLISAEPESANSTVVEPMHTDPFFASSPELSLPQLPTRLLHPALEIHAPIRKSELWVIGEQAFVVCDVHFEQRLEGIEWWSHNRVFRDYFRVWLERVGARIASTSWRAPNGDKRQADISGLEALVYRDRERGKSYLHALFD
jgi:hypothetical protein